MYFDDVQIRLIILYTLKCFKISMSEENMQEALVFSDIIDYFTMKDFVLDMQNMGLISTVVIENTQRFDITPKGVETLGMFKNKIPLSIRDKIYDKCYDMLSKISRGREIVADIVPVDEKKFLAKCGIYEFGVPLIELNVFAGTRAHAREMAERFRTESAMLYKIILEKIIEEQ